jgi:amidophosphoribosyltransferase
MSGTFGNFPSADAAAITALGRHALQHRQAAGTVSFDRESFRSKERHSLIDDSLSWRNMIERLPGGAAIDHALYLALANAVVLNEQPALVVLVDDGIALAQADMTRYWSQYNCSSGGFPCEA